MGGNTAGEVKKSILKHPLVVGLIVTTVASVTAWGVWGDYIKLILFPSVAKFEVIYSSPQIGLLELKIVPLNKAAEKPENLICRAKGWGVSKEIAYSLDDAGNVYWVLKIKSSEMLDSLLKADRKLFVNFHNDYGLKDYELHLLSSKVNKLLKRPTHVIATTADSLRLRTQPLSPSEMRDANKGLSSGIKALVSNGDTIRILDSKSNRYYHLIEVNSADTVLQGYLVKHYGEKETVKALGKTQEKNSSKKYPQKVAGESNKSEEVATKTISLYVEPPKAWGYTKDYIVVVDGDTLPTPEASNNTKQNKTFNFKVPLKKKHFTKIILIKGNEKVEVLGVQQLLLDDNELSITW